MKDFRKQKVWQKNKELSAISFQRSALKMKDLNSFQLLAISFQFKKRSRQQSVSQRSA
jgi:hypothetical protein